MSPKVRVTFEPWGATADVDEGVTILEAARAAGAALPATCGGAGTCGGCAVRVLEGEAEPPGERESRALPKGRPGVRLACLARVSSPLTVRPLAAPSLDALEGGATTAAPAAPGEGTAPRGRRGLSIGVDLGTSTIAVALCDPDGVLAVHAVRNPQSAFGADIGTRLSASEAGEAGALAGAAGGAIGQAVTAVLDAAGEDAAGIGRLVIAGNTAMAHLLVRADVSKLGRHPYEPAWTGALVGHASTFGIPVVPADSEVYVVPALGAFVGGDVTAGLVALGLDEAEEPVAFVDLGTNAEVAVCGPGGVVAASAPAGPAFEGVGLSCGGPALPGAVDRVDVDAHGLRLRVIGGGAPRWLCGSGLLDAVAALRSSGHLDAGGRLVPDGLLAGRFDECGGVLRVTLTEPGRGDAVYLTQLDVRALQLAKAAVSVALRFALERAAGPHDVPARFIVAGAFGEAMRPGVLSALGIAPEGWPAEESAGNTSLAGAALLSRDAEARCRAETLAREARVLDLPAEGGFGERFLSATAFP